MPSEPTKPMSSCELTSVYLRAKEHVLNAGYGEEVEWQTNVDFDEVTESDFLKETAWVILSAGFRESVVRRCFAKVSDAFLGWHDAKRIYEQREECLSKALKIFANQQKMEAIAEVVRRVAENGIEIIKEQIRVDGISVLERLPYIGPVTSYHLAKNLGLAAVKPDRHLVRIADASGYRSAHEMCSRISEAVGDSLSVVDLVLWRYATLNRKYEAEFGISLRGS